MSRSRMRSRLMYFKLQGECMMIYVFFLHDEWWHQIGHIYPNFGMRSAGTPWLCLLVFVSKYSQFPLIVFGYGIFSHWQLMSNMNLPIENLSNSRLNVAKNCINLIIILTWQKTEGEENKWQAEKNNNQHMISVNMCFICFFKLNKYRIMDGVALRYYY